MRREGSYIYEEFMPTGGTDVKVVLLFKGYIFLFLLAAYVYYVVNFDALYEI